MAVAVAGCSKECPEGLETSFLLNLSMDEAKTTVSPPNTSGRRTVLWKAGDKVSVNGIVSKGLASIYDGGAKAVFEFPETPSLPYNILYPASMYIDGFHVLLPAVQNAMPGDDDFATDTVPMAACSENVSENVQMKHLCSAIKIQWKQASSGTDSDKMLYLEFSGGNGEQVSGRFAIDYANATLSGCDSGNAAGTVRVLSGKSQSGKTCVTNIIIPAGTYAKGFKIRLVDAAGHFMEKTLTSSKTFLAGKVYSFPELEFVPTGTLFVIDTKEKLQSWASGDDHKAAGDKVVLGADIDMKGESWTPFAFDGDFDGLGHSITNLVVEKDGDATFFGTISGSVKNIVFGSESDESVFRSLKTGTGSVYAGAIRNATGTAVIDNVVSYADVEYSGTTTGTLYAGGIVGSFGSSSVVSNCIFAGKLSILSSLGAAGNIGGICGSVSTAACLVNSCINKGELLVSSSYTASINYGAVVGYCSVAATIANCVNEGSIKTSGTTSPTSGQTSIGGILGYNNSIACTIRACINKGSVQKGNNNTKRPSYVGGIVGYTNQGILIENCLNDISATVKNTANCGSKQLSVGGIAGGAYTDAVASRILSCVNAGAVSNTTTATPRYLGGIVGFHSQGDAGNTPKIVSCVNTGKISDKVSTGILQLGGIAGCMSRTQAEIDNCRGEGEIDVPSSRLATCGAVIGVQTATMVSCTAIPGIKVGGHILTSGDLEEDTLKGNGYKYVRGTDSTGDVLKGEVHENLDIDDLDQTTDTGK